MWVKICGTTSLADARMGAQAEADALGFIFAPGSRRLVTPQHAAEICAAIAAEFPAVERIGVFTQSTAEEIAAVVVACGLTGVQLQSAFTQECAPELRERLSRIKVVAAFPWSGEEDFAARFLSNQRSAHFDAFLVDSSTSQQGGTGRRFAWQEAVASFRLARDAGLPLIAAGGLSPENVTEAVTLLRSWGVDAVTAVESSPGVKDGPRVRAFVAAAKH